MHEYFKFIELREFILENYLDDVLTEITKLIENPLDNSKDDIRDRTLLFSTEKNKNLPKEH